MTKADKKLEKLYSDIAKYLKPKGWKIIVVGGMSIIQKRPDLKYKYTLQIDFSGEKIINKP